MQIKINVILLVSLIVFNDVTAAQTTFEKGNWEIVSEFNCVETQRFDGKALVQVKSAEQRLTKGYLISEVSKTEFFEFKTIVTDTNGKPDCLGQNDSEIGNELHLYLKLNEGENEMHFYLFPDEAGYIDVYLRKLK